MQAASAAAEFEARADGVLTVSGPLVFATVAAAWPEGLAAIAAQRPRVLDLAGVDRGDSAGLACVLAWLAHARGGLRVANAPESIRALAHVSDAGRWLEPA